MSGLAIDQFRTEGPQMSTFKVDICRTAYSFARIPVRASNLAEAQLKALDVSGDQLYTEKSSEYTLVDPEPEVQRALLQEQPADLSSQPMPFMTAVGNHVLIHDGYSGNPLADDWQGVCVDGFDNNSYWYIGRSGGERSYTKLRATEAQAAEREGQIAAGVEQAVEKIAQQWDKCLYNTPAETIDIGQCIRSVARQIAVNNHSAPLHAEPPLDGMEGADEAQLVHKAFDEVATRNRERGSET